MKPSLHILFVLIMISLSSCKTDTLPSQQSIAVSELGKLKIDHKDIIFLDVRTPKEIANGKIMGDALEIDFYSDGFKTDIAKLDKKKPYLVYCKSGGRSSQAIQIMSSLGFTTLYNLEGGYTAWSKLN